MLAYKDDVIGQNTKGIEFLFKKNKVDWLKGWGSIPEPGKVKVGDETHEAKTHHHRHRLRAASPARRRGRREDRRHLHRRAGTAQGPQDPGGDRRRRDRAGAGLGLCPARRRGDGDRVSRRDHPRHGRRGARRPSSESLKKQGLDFIMGAAVQKVETARRQGQGHLQAAQGRQRARASTPTWCSWPPGANPIPTGSGSTRWGSR